jgi:hypothetical protein
LRAVYFSVALIGAHVPIVARIPIKMMSGRSISDYQPNWPLVAKVERLLHTKMDAAIGNSGAIIGQLNSCLSSERA